MTREDRAKLYMKFCYELYDSPIYGKGDLFQNIQFYAERNLGLEYFQAVELGMKGRDIILAIRKLDPEMQRKEFTVKFVKTFAVLSQKKAS